MASKQMIIDVIDRFNGLENFDIFFDDGDLADDYVYYDQMKTLETNFNDTNIIEPLKKGEFIAPRYFHDRIEEEIMLSAALCKPMSNEIQEEAFGLIALNECTNLKNIARQYRSQIEIHEETTNKTYKIPKALTQDLSNK
ncbi:unnamed protein product [Rotaria sp. Silwood1]|nr:unnamed protein product [Rotaria sp. Silwood1]